MIQVQSPNLVAPQGSTAYETADIDLTSFVGRQMEDLVETRGDVQTVATALCVLRQRCAHFARFDNLHPFNLTLQHFRAPSIVSENVQLRWFMAYLGELSLCATPQM